MLDGQLGLLTSYGSTLFIPTLLTVEMVMVKPTVDTKGLAVGKIQVLRGREIEEPVYLKMEE